LGKKQHAHGHAKIMIEERSHGEINDVNDKTMKTINEERKLPML